MADTPAPAQASTDDLDRQIQESAAKLGDLVASHPAIAKYAEASQALRKDPEAGRLLQQFEQRAMVIARNEQVGQPVTQAERADLDRMQATIAGNLRVKAFSIAQADMTDLLRKTSQTWQRPVARAQGDDEDDASPAAPPRGGRESGLVF